jgi:hypothetical protein
MKTTYGEQANFVTIVSTAQTSTYFSCQSWRTGRWSRSKFDGSNFNFERQFDQLQSIIFSFEIINCSFVIVLVCNMDNGDKFWAGKKTFVSSADEN